MNSHKTMFDDVVNPIWTNTHTLFTSIEQLRAHSIKNVEDVQQQIALLSSLVDTVFPKIKLLIETEQYLSQYQNSPKLPAICNENLLSDYLKELKALTDEVLAQLASLSNHKIEYPDLNIVKQYNQSELLEWTQNTTQMLMSKEAEISKQATKMNDYIKRLHVLFGKIKEYNAILPHYLKVFVSFQEKIMTSFASSNFGAFSQSPSNQQQIDSDNKTISNATLKISRPQ